MGFCFCGYVYNNIHYNNKLITLIIGNVGSGKTLYSVYLLLNKFSHCNVYSNIITRGVKHNTLLNASMITKEEKDEKGKVISKKVNIDFWKEQIEKGRKKGRPITVILDECHTLFNSRNIMANQHRLNWLAVIRKVLGSADKRSGELVMISQLSRRIDIIAREMANRVIYVINHYDLKCKCGFTHHYTNLSPEIPFDCPLCKKELKKENSIIEAFHFTSAELFDAWTETNNPKLYYKRTRLDNVEEYYKYYDTYQFDDLLT